MTYNLNFLLKVEKDDSHIVHDPEGFTGEPIPISGADITKLIDNFIKSKSFKKVGIVEKASSKTVQDKKETEVDSSLGSQGQPSKKSSANASTALKSLSGEACICKSKELDEAALKQFCTELSQYLQECCSKISPENFLTEESNLSFSGLREVIELRNYLATYTNSKKKNYQNGYLYIMRV